MRTAVLIALLLTGLVACNNQPPPAGDQNLPVNQAAVVGLDDDAVGLCRRDDAGNLIVRFNNTGELAANSQPEVRVTFNVGDTDPVVTQTMPVIPAGGSVDMAFQIPTGCFSADCFFSIQWSNQPAQSGTCIG